MALTRITKGVIKPNENYDTHNINSTGIVTAIGFKGPFTGSSDIQSGIVTATKIDLNGDIDVDGHTNLDNVNVAGVTTFAANINGTNASLSGSISAATANFTGNVTIGGTLTYEDLTNVDAVGLVTARTGVVSPYADIDDWIDVGNNIQLGNAGVVTATTFVGALTGTASGNTTVSNNADNRVITGGSGNALNGEAALTFDGQTLTVSAPSNDTPLIVDTASSNGAHLRFQKDGANKHFVGSGGGFGLGDIDDLAFRTVDNLIFGVGTSEKLRIDSSGRVLVGSDSVRIAGDVNAQLQVEGTSYHTSSLALIANSGASSGNNSHLTLAKSRGSSDGSNTILVDDDSIGIIQWAASDGTDLNCVAANIRARVDGTPGSNDMPGSLEFGTTADGAAAPTKILTITSGGNLYHTGGGNGRRYSFAGDGSSHYMKHDTTLNGIILNGYGGIAFETNGTNERVRITSAGKVGIRTDNVTTTLHVRGNGVFTQQTGGTITNGLFLDPGDTGQGNRPDIILKGAGSAGLSQKAMQVYYNNGSDEAFHLRYDGGAYFGGAIGIGIDSPVTKLHLQDGQFTIKSSGECGPYLYRNNGSGPDLVFHSGRGSSFTSPTASGGTDLLGNINFAGYDGSAYQRRASINGVIDGTVSSNTVPTAIYFRTGTTTGLERLRITSGGIIQCGTSGTLKAEINNAVSGHQFISQCSDNNNGFEVYQQHGSTSTRNTFAVYANTGNSAAKQSQFIVKGDNSVHIMGNKNTNHLNISSAITPSGAHSYGDEARIQFSMYNEVPQFTGNPAATIAAYLQRGNNGFGLKFYARHNAGTLFNSLDLNADYQVLPGVDGVQDLGSDSKRWRRSYVQNAYPILSTVQNITGSSFSSGSWYDTGFRRDSMGGLDVNGTYIITAFADTHAAGGGNYSCTYTWIVGIKDQSTNQNASNDVPLLSVTGHSTNNQVLALRTTRQSAGNGGQEWIQWKASSTWTSIDNSSSGRILRFTAQRIGRVYT